MNPFGDVEMKSLMNTIHR